MRFIFLALAIVLVSACTSMQTVRLDSVSPNPERSSVAAGDRVQVNTRTGERLNFVVTEVTADGLSGGFGFVRFDDIGTLKVEQPGMSENTQYWLLGVLGAAAAIALIASADSASVCSGTPCPPQ